MNFFDPAAGLLMWQAIGFSIVILYVFTVGSVALSKFKEGTHQLLWLLVVLTAPLLGTVLWFALGRKYKAV
jgi:hypothetical protein